MTRVHRPFWILTIAVGSALMLPTLLSEGTFLDGTIYAVLARNLAAGEGSFWSPYYSLRIPFWTEHPPLGINIASLFYRVCGEGLWVESLYSFVTALICGFLIVMLWRQADGDRDRLRELSWLPLLFWLLNPQVTWSHSNNMLENTMTIFTLSAVLLVLRSCGGGSRWALWLVAGSFALVAAALTKGVVGFFPLATLIAYQAATRRLGWRRAAARSVLLLAVTAALLALALTQPAAQQNIAGYINGQFIRSLGGERGAADNHFIFLVKLFNSLLPALVIAGVFWLLGRRRPIGAVPTSNLKPCGLTFLLLALAGSIPLLASPRQSLFYVLPSFPLYALALALFLAPAASAMVEKLGRRARRLHALQVVSVLLLGATLVFSFTKIGTYNRSETAMRDIKMIGAHVKAELGLADQQEAALAVCPRLWRAWSLDASLARYHRLAMALEDSASPFLLVDVHCAEDLGEEFLRVPLPTSRYHLYTRRGAASQ